MNLDLHGHEVYASAVSIIGFSNCLLFRVHDIRDTRGF